MNKQTYRNRAYACYSSAFRGGRVSHAGDSPAASRYRAYLRRRLGCWLDGVPRSAAVADLGCGDGMLLRVFQELGFSNLQGVDGSPEMVAACKQHFPAVEAGDLRDYLRKSINRFDVIALFDVIEHFTREEGVEVLDEICAALRPGGLLLLQLPNGDSPFAGAVFANDATHETLYTRVSLAHVLAMSGFRTLGAEEHSPELVDLRSGFRWLGWKLLRTGIALCHRIETGGVATGLYARVMRVAAVKL